MTDELDERESNTLSSKRGLWGRLLAIGLFVGLGSFAVSQSLVGDRQVAEQQTVAESSGEPADSTGPLIDDPTSTPAIQALKTAITVTQDPEPQTGPSANSNASPKNVPSAFSAAQSPPNLTTKPATGGPPTSKPQNDFAVNGQSTPPPRSFDSAASGGAAASFQPTGSPTKPLGQPIADSPSSVPSPGTGTPPNANPNPNAGNRRGSPNGDNATSPATQESATQASAPSSSRSPAASQPNRSDVANNSKDSPTASTGTSPSPFNPSSPTTTNPASGSNLDQARANALLDAVRDKPSTSPEEASNPPSRSSFVPNDLRNSLATKSPASVPESMPPSRNFGGFDAQSNANTLNAETKSTSPAAPPTDVNEPRATQPQEPLGGNPLKANPPSRETTSSPFGNPSSEFGAGAGEGSPGSTANAPTNRPANELGTPGERSPNPLAARPVATPSPSRFDGGAPPQGIPPSGTPSPIGARIPQAPATLVASANTLPTPGDSKWEGLQQPSLAIEKIAPPEIQVGQAAKFKIAVKNVGQVAATDVSVHDQIPAGTDLLGATPAVTRQSADGKIEWDLGEMVPGEEKVILLELRPNRPGEIGSVAQVTFATRAAMRTRVTKPVLEIEHSGPERTMIGNRVPLKIVVYNRGDGDAKDVLIQESVPQQLKYNDSFRDLEYPVGTIPPGESREIILNLTAVEAGRFRNLVCAVGAGGLQAKHQLDMEVVAPKLVAQGDGPNRRFLKRDAVHQFTTVNQGTAAATNLDLIAKLPRGVQFAGANNQGQYDPGSHAVYWSLSELKPNQSASVELTTTPVETGQHEIEFRANADLNQATSFKQPLMIEHLVDVFFEIDDIDDHIEVGSQVQYEIRVVNQGTKPANNVRLSLEIQPGIRPVSIEGETQGEIRGQSVLFAPITNINPGEEFLIKVIGVGVTPGEHRVSANLQTDGREINISKEESTRVYADR